MRAIRALVLEQMAQVFARKQAEQFAATRPPPGNLEIDDARHSVRALQPVRLLGQIVVRDSAPTHLLEHGMGLAIPGRLRRFGLLHGLAIHVAAFKHTLVPTDELRKSVQSGERREHTRLARGCRARKPAQAESCAARITSDPAALAIAHPFDAAHGVGFEQLNLHGSPVPAARVPAHLSLDIRDRLRARPRQRQTCPSISCSSCWVSC